MTRYSPNIKRLILTLLLIIVSGIFLYYFFRSNSLNYFNGRIDINFKENIFTIFIVSIIWLLPYLYFYISSFRDITKYFVECDSYFMIRTHSIKKLFYYIFIRLFIELFFINVFAFLIGILIKFPITISMLVSNILRGGIVISLMLGVGLSKQHVSEYLTSLFSFIFIMSIVSNIFTKPNIITVIFLNYGSSYMLSLLLLIIMIVIQGLFLQLYKRVDM